MKLTRIRLEQFKQFRQFLEIRDLDPGLNLFTGPNEAGKSSIVEAIRVAFFERHRSSSVEHLRPWGDPAAAPGVELDFLLQGQECRLSKRFLGKKRCHLRIGTTQLDGADAEDRLAELLGYQHAGKGASKEEHWGIPGLLWVRQGAAQDLHAPVEHALDHLRTALNAALGEMAGGEGDDIAWEVQTLRNELLTASAGKPRGDLAEALERVARLEQTLNEQDAANAAYRERVDQLADLRRSHAADAAEQPWLPLRQAQQQAASKLEQAQRLETTLREERQRERQLETQLQLLRERLDSYAAQETALARRRHTLDAAHQTHAEALARLGEGQAREEEAQQRHAAARACLSRSRLAAHRLDLARQDEESRQRLATLSARLEQAGARQEELLRLQAQLAAIPLPDAELAALREAETRLRELRIRRDAIATRLQYRLRENATLALGEETLRGAGERLLTETTRLHLPGLGQLDITPGGEDLAALRRQEQTLADQQTARLQRLGLNGLTQAEQRKQQQQQLQGEIQAATAALRAHAPQGLEALRAERNTLAARAGEIQTTLAGLPLPAPEAPAPPPVPRAEADEESARAGLELAQQQLNQARLALGHAEADRDAARRELAAAEALLAAPDRAPRLREANQRLMDARAEQDLLEQRIATLQGQLAEARPDILKQDVERYRKSADQAEQLQRERAEKILRLEVELQSAGAAGLDEQRAATQRDLEQALRRRHQLLLRAQALDLLLNLLRDKRAALTRRLQAPLQNHLHHYLQLLFPRARLEIDEHLRPGPLTRCDARGEETGDFQALSFGAREQMGVISRLAYADLLREAGRPTLLILDDALVHSDETRLAQMKRLLFDAALRHQILVFTCHPAHWRDLGVAARSLEELKAATAG